jgi:CHAT domain-containing protein/tetratricopeptide (TPR) repeat protein
LNQPDICVPKRPLYRLSRALGYLVIALLAHAAMAQEDTLPAALGHLSPDRVRQLQAVLAAPVPTQVLNRTLAQHFQDKEAAALQLGELPATLAVYRDWMAHLPDTVPLNNFANALMRAGEHDEALRVRKRLIDSVKPNIYQEMYRRNYAENLFDTGQIDEARQNLDVVRQKLDAYGKQGLYGRELVFLRRIDAGAQRLASAMNLRTGKLSQATELARATLTSARQGLQLAQALPERSRRPMDVGWAASNVIEALAQLAACLEEGGQPDEADEAMREQLRLAREMDLEPRQFGAIYRTAGRLRLSTRAFAQAERHLRQADQVFDSLGTPPLAQTRVNVAQGLVMALSGQGRWADALTELSRLDAQAGKDAALQARVRLPLFRAYAYLGSGTRTAEAARLMPSWRDDLSRRYPPHHIEVVQAEGLQGVALWRLGTPPERAQALALLKDAVSSYMLPDNAAQASAGIRPDIRALVFATYFDAMWHTPGERTLDTMAPADWLRAGSVQQALTDSALRASVNDPELAPLVRTEQDARIEVQALRKYLAGDADEQASPSPEASARMRARIAELERTRQDLQAQIQRRFPDHAQLVNPTPLSPAALSQQLEADEALVLILPTEEATYVWALKRSGQGQAVRVALTLPQLKALVQALRKTLDFNEMGGRVRPFDTQTAHQLYAQLLAPVEQITQGKQHLIIAAGGPLAQLPLAVLLTRPTPKLNADAPWLIRQAALSYVPSLSAWTAVKRLARATPAPEPFAGWGDPQFKPQTVVTASRPAEVRDLTHVRAAPLMDLDLASPAGMLRYGDIPPLPDTRDELASIARALQADPQRDLHLGGMATRSSVLQSSQSGELQRKRVIAFATHGLMAGELPHLSQPALALAATGDEAHPLDALLTLDDVLGLKLRADWVLLSACNTAAADGQAGDALSGLARGFFYAGAHSLLVTHWAVESESARRLTTATFAHYTQQVHARKAESLRQAMLDVQAMPRFAHPAFWAPYALVGDGER